MNDSRGGTAPGYLALKPIRVPYLLCDGSLKLQVSRELRDRRCEVTVDEGNEVGGLKLLGRSRRSPRRYRYSASRGAVIHAEIWPSLAAGPYEAA